MVNETHESILQLSPFNKIAEIFKTTEPLSLKEIKEIFDEVKRCNSSQSKEYNSNIFCKKEWCAF